MMMGRIDEVDGHYIATRFVAFLLPVECLYVARDGRTTMSGRGSDLRIQTDWRSVMLAYGRVWLPILAAALPVGAVSAMYYADRLYQLPIGVIAIAIGTVLLPELSRRFASGDERHVRRAQRRAVLEQ